MKTTLCHRVSACAALALAAAAYAQPANDDCINAITVANHSVTPFDMTGATLDATYSNFSCNHSSSRKDIWFRYVAAGPESVTVTLCGSSPGTRRILTAFAGSCSGQELYCEENVVCGPEQPSITFNAAEAGVYIIAVSIRGTPAGLDGILHIDGVSTIQPPSNDDCDHAEVITGPGNIAFSNALATTQGPSGTCNYLGASDSRDLFYSYTAATAQYITFDTLLSGPTADTTLQVYDGCGGELLFCNDDDDSFTYASKSCPILTVPGHTYIVRVASWGADGFSAPVSGVLRTSVAQPASPYSPPSGALLEPGGECDDYEHDVNRACNPADNTLRETPINLCDTYIGHAPSRPPTTDGSFPNDNDSYSFTVTTQQTVTVTGQTQFNAIVSFSSGCGFTNDFNARGTVFTNARCGVADFALSAVFPPGTYRVSVANWYDSTAACGFNDEYWFHLAGTEPCPTACAADLGASGGQPGHDGQLNNNDFIAFINYFFDADSAADFGTSGGLAGHDGLFDNNDFIAFINAFFNGCP